MSALFLLLNGLVTYAQPAPNSYDLDVTATASMMDGTLAPNTYGMGQLHTTATGAPAAMTSPGAGYTFTWSTVKVMRRATSTSGTWATYNDADISFPPHTSNGAGDQLAEIKAKLPKSGYYQIFLKAKADWWLGTLNDRGTGTSPETTVYVNVPLTMSLQTVSFGGSNHTVYRDTGAQDAYAAPHWDKSRAEPSSPVCYTRNSPIKAGATFSIAQTTANETVKIKGVAGTYEFPAQDVTVQGGLATYTEAQANNPLPNSIRPGGAFGITWSFSNDNGSTWQLAGTDGTAATSTNQMYVTLGTPTAPKLFHTLLHIGCGRNDGGTVEATVAANIWAEFSDRSVTRVNWPVQNPSPPVIAYWGPNWDATAVETSGLLAMDKGQCGSWGHFFHDVLAAQGISSDFLYLFPVYQNQAADDQGEYRGLLLVKKWTFNTLSSNPQEDNVTFQSFDYEQNGIIDNSGAAGQGNGNPPGAFHNHFIVKYAGKYYDPSYGNNPYGVADTDAGKAAWEDASLDGFGKLFLFYDNLNQVVDQRYLFKKNSIGSTKVETIFSYNP